MMRLDAREKLYKKFKNGDGGALQELLEAERPDLYDYLMRMTGQVTRSADTVDEVYQSLSEETLEVVDSHAELRVVLYTTARKFNADIWNADTGKLVNLALEQPVDGGEVSERVLRDRQAFKVLDKGLRTLPGREREAVILKVRSGFDFAGVAEIMGLSAAEAEANHSVGLRSIMKEGSDVASGFANLDAALQTMPVHPPPIRSSQATMNLSMVMQGIKTKPVGLNSPVRIALLLLIIALGIAYLLNPEWFH